MLILPSKHFRAKINAHYIFAIVTEQHMPHSAEQITHRLHANLCNGRTPAKRVNRTFLFSPDSVKSTGYARERIFYYSKVYDVIFLII
jgi:hypothetical protein